MNTQPLYAQIAESIARRIRSGELAVGDQLPSERELSEELKVSRMTLRQALALLRDQGLIDGQHGRGNFVSGPRFEQPVDVLVGFTDNMVRRGVRPGARILSLQSRLADRAIARSLQVAVGEPIYGLHRVRLADDTPVALEHSYFPAQRCPNLYSFDLEKRSVYAVLAEEFGIKLGRARQSLEPTVARPDEADLLGVPEGAPLMLIERTSYDDQQRAVEYAKDLYRGDCFRFVCWSQPPSTS
ncbi:MAG: GntR family transcriptional regulator [Anaerolineae bacterium]